MFLFGFCRCKVKVFKSGADYPDYGLCPYRRARNGGNPLMDSLPELFDAIEMQNSDMAILMTPDLTALARTLFASSLCETGEETYTIR